MFIEAEDQDGPLHIDLQSVMDVVKMGMTDHIDLDFYVEHFTENCYYKSTIHPDYGVLASRYCMYHIHRKTSDSFVETVKALMENVHPKTGKCVPLLTQELYDIVLEMGDEYWQSILDYRLDYKY